MIGGMFRKLKEKVSRIFMTQEEKARIFLADLHGEDRAENLLTLAKRVAAANDVPLDLAAEFISDHAGMIPERVIHDQRLAYRKSKSQAKNWSKWRKRWSA